MVNRVKYRENKSLDSRIFHCEKMGSSRQDFVQVVVIYVLKMVKLGGRERVVC
jgi:hypothetical protein